MNKKVCENNNKKFTLRYYKYGMKQKYVFKFQVAHLSLEPS